MPAVLEHPARFLDLTRKLFQESAPFRDGSYCDPSFEISPWCEVATQGFKVSKLSLGTQSGTHIDAPAHFDERGATLESLELERMIGAFERFDLPERSAEDDIRSIAERLEPGTIPFFRATHGVALLSAGGLAKLIERSGPLWVLAGEIEVERGSRYAFHRRLAESGKFLVEDLDPVAVREVPERGTIYVMPLNIAGVSGAPCRVAVREPY